MGGERGEWGGLVNRYNRPDPLVQSGHLLIGHLAFVVGKKGKTPTGLTPRSGNYN